MKHDEIASNKKLLTVKELCEKLSISRITLHRWNKRGIPKIPIGKTGFRYEYAAVVEWLKDGGAKQ